MIRRDAPLGTTSGTGWNRLYWCTRLGIAFVWLWTAFVSWFIYPHASSLDMLRIAGITAHTELVFAGACLLDLAMGIASCVFAAPVLWWSQFLIVAAYSVIVGIFLPEFLVHPFGPIVKNIPLLACLAFLALADRR